MPSIINATTTNGVAISPDNSGSLQLATNNGTTAVTIDTSQNVGIGTSSPASRLAILENTNGNSILNVRNTNAGSSATSILALGNDGALNGAYLVLNSSTNTSGGAGNSLNITNGFNAPMTFGTNGTERMRIDSSGRVTMPYQPAFKCAWGNRNATGSGRIISTNAGDAAVTGRDEFNRGSHFSASTGRFTCPVAGVYLMGFQGMRNESNGTQLDCRIKKNGGNIWARAYRASFNNNYEYWSLVTISNCAAGDYFEVDIAGNTSIYGDDTYSFGYLIG